MGLRELKKERTRQEISDHARDLFLERGFADVTVGEVALQAGVSPATVYNYFPTKESLVFDREDEMDAEMVAALRARKKSVLDTLYDHFLKSKLIDPPSKKTHADFMRLIRSSPELSLYFRGIWDRYGKTLAREIASESQVTRVEAECMAWMILEAVNFACHSPSPKEALGLSFRLLKNGWNK